MKIIELENAPEWLKAAKVVDEDVKIINDIVVWISGTWESGTWESGIWKEGTWKGGLVRVNARCKWAVHFDDVWISIGCKCKSSTEWDAWFADEANEYETPRYDPQFRAIRDAYELAKLQQAQHLRRIAREDRSNCLEL